MHYYPVYSHITWITNQYIGVIYVIIGNLFELGNNMKVYSTNH